jgi:nitroimidazol reductase NimA-like FMN-containing flavoprotein (pyridoxamine 5'-phosphate oxidase superfamily)
MGDAMQAPSARTMLKRGPTRARYEQEAIRAILDEALYCNVAVDVGGHPAIIPTAFAVVGDQLYVHGSTANRVFRAMRDGAECCVSVTLLDGLVLARSAFHHSVNYRSVVIYGFAREVDDEVEKRAAFDALIEHVMPGRSANVREPNDAEYVRTLVLAISIEEASAKVRSGPPAEEEEDYALDVWAGELPLRVVAQSPVADPQTEVEVPSYVLDRRDGLS